MNMIRLQWAALAVSASILTACGGGADEGATGPTSNAEGFWTGTTSNGWAVNLAILENGETWGVYSYGSTIYGALQGSTKSSAGALSGSGNDYYVPSRTVTSGSYSGTYTAQSTIKVALSSGVTFNGSYSSAYDQAASLTDVAGTYSGTSVSGYSSLQSTPVTITSNGDVSVPSTNGCSATGQLAPRSSGKNVFNVSMAFTGTNCALGNGATTTGVAYYDNTKRQLLTVALNSAKSDGFIYIGSK